MNTRSLVLMAAAVFCVGCYAKVGSDLSVPEDATQTCQSHCHSIGLRLSAVAIMADNVGCVCQADDAPAAGRQEAVTGGMATIFMQEQQRQRNQQAHKPTQ